MFGRRQPERSNWPCVEITLPAESRKPARTQETGLTTDPKALPLAFRCSDADLGFLMRQTVRIRSVALDARKLARRRTGVGHYVARLVRNLPQLLPSTDILLLTDKVISDSLVPPGCRQVVLGRACVEDSTAARLYSPVWMNSLVPACLVRERVQLFHGTNFVVPLRKVCPTVVTVHDVAFVRVPHTFSPVYRAYMRTQVRWSMSHSDRIIAMTEHAKQDMIACFGTDARRIEVTYVGYEDGYGASVDSEQRNQTQRALDLPKRFALHVGVIEARKNIETLLRASVRPLANGLMDAVVLVGKDGLGVQEVHRTAAELGIAHQVKFLGYVDQKHMPSVYTLASALIFPSVFEGFGVPVLEAMACGTPVIASDRASIPEVAGDAALLIDPYDADAFELALTRVLTDAVLREDLKSRGRARARRFTWREAARRHLHAYMEALSCSADGAASPIAAGPTSPTKP
jgi:glycosyltransferase involved in cell wall biosynthesis